MYNPATVDLSTYELLQYTEESGVNSIGASVIFERNLLSVGGYKLCDQLDSGRD